MQSDNHTSTVCSGIERCVTWLKQSDTLNNRLNTHCTFPIGVMCVYLEIFLFYWPYLDSSFILSWSYQTVVTVTWYTQESRDNNTYRIQEDIPRLDAMTACFRYKPVNITGLLESKYIFTISDDGKSKLFDSVFAMSISFLSFHFCRAVWLRSYDIVHAYCHWGPWLTVDRFRRRW